MDTEQIFAGSFFEPGLYGEETLSDYAFDGYHPISLGDEMDQGRYQIRHKLGYGCSSTVWLARDAKLEKWVAIKIMKASISKHITGFLDVFFHHGPNGSHQCLVLNLLGPTLDRIHRIISENYFSGMRYLGPGNILRLTKQLLEAVASLHKADSMHGGIWPSKVAFTSRNMNIVGVTECIPYTSPCLSHMLEEEVMQILGCPKSKQCVRLDGKPLDPGMPKQIVTSAIWKDWTQEYDEDIQLIDLGFTFVHGSQSYDRKTPEALFTDTMDYRADLFRTGFLIYTLLFGGDLLFSNYGSVEYMVTEMIGLIEELPEEWKPKWKQYHNAYNHRRVEKGWLRHDSQSDSLFRLKQAFDDSIHNPILKNLFPIIAGLMRFRPSDRIEASEALELVNSIIETEKTSNNDQS